MCHKEGPGHRHRWNLSFVVFHLRPLPGCVHLRRPGDLFLHAHHHLSAKRLLLLLLLGRIRREGLALMLMPLGRRRRSR